MERECVSTLSICSFLRALRYLIILKIAFVFMCFENFICFMLTLVSVLKSVDKAFFENGFESVR